MEYSHIYSLYFIMFFNYFLIIYFMFKSIYKVQIGSDLEEILKLSPIGDLKENLKSLHINFT